MHPQEVRTTTITLCSSEKKNLISMAKSYYNLPKTVPVTGYTSLDEYLFDECLLSNFHSSVLITLYTQPHFCKTKSIFQALYLMCLQSSFLSPQEKSISFLVLLLLFSLIYQGPRQPVPDQWIIFKSSCFLHCIVLPHLNFVSVALSYI